MIKIDSYIKKTSPLLWIPLSDNGKAFSDESGNGNAASVTGSAIQYGQTGISSEKKAARFYGALGSVLYKSGFKLNGPHTVIFAVNPNSFFSSGKYPGILKYGIPSSSPYDGYIYFYSSTGVISKKRLNVTVGYSGALSIGNYSLFGFSNNTADELIYLNGDLVSTQAFALSNITAESDLIIGYGDTVYQDHFLNHIIIYDRCISGAEHKNIARVMGVAPKITIGGNAKTKDNAPASDIVIYDEENNYLYEAIPDSSGDWTAEVLADNLMITANHGDYPPQVSGPHTVSEFGVSPAIPDIVLGSSSGTMKTVGYAF